MQYLFITLIFLFGYIFLAAQVSFAYTTGMSANIVIGQKDFISAKANQGGSIGANTVSSPSAMFVINNKLIVADNANNRILIYNTMPSSSNTSANVVIGQSNMTNTSSGCAANQLNLGDGSIFSINNKLFIADMNNNRVLVYSSIPTTNGVSANIIIGQSNATTCTANTGSIGPSTLSKPDSITSDGTKLIISDSGNNRVLIYNTIPAANNASANIVIGQQDFVTNTANTGTIGADTLSSPKGVAYFNGSLVVADMSNNRALIYATIPSSNGVLADNVIGQADFTSSSITSTTAKTVQPFHIAIDTTGKLYITDKAYNRTLIYGKVPNTDNASADTVIGQQNFTTGTANTGGVSASSVFNPRGVFATSAILFIADSNNRILMYTSSSIKPGVMVSNTAKGETDDSITLSGTATVNTPYTINTVQYSINGGGWYDATSAKGAFSTAKEDFSFNFFDTDNENKTIGYTARARSINSNADVSDAALYFQPFDANRPDNNEFIDNQYPTFDFSVNTQHDIVSNTLTKYQIQIAKGNTSNWQVYLDTIPVDFLKVKNNSDNIQKNKASPQDVNGIYETQTIYAVYDENSSHILVRAKEIQAASFDQGGKQLSGTYKWKAVAVDNAGHTQETPSQFMRVNSTQTLDSTTYFPLTILTISDIGNVAISSLDPKSIQDTYTIHTTTPTFYGIAVVNAAITAALIDQDCVTHNGTDCESDFTTVANPQSRFGINIPVNTLQYGKKYDGIFSAVLNNNYVELPKFTLAIGNQQTQKTNQIDTTVESALLRFSPQDSQVCEDAKQYVIEAYLTNPKYKYCLHESRKYLLFSPKYK